MKKIITLLLVMAFVLVGCNNAGGKIKQENITVNQIEEKIKNKETFAYVVASKTCVHCNELKDMLKEYNSNKTIYIFETTTATQDDIKKLIAKYPNLNSTPTTFFYANGELKDTVVGYEKETITKKLDEFFK